MGYSHTKKIAWVTGASSGIGEATVKYLIKEGWCVAVTARSEDKLKEMEKLSDRIVAFAGDVTDAKEMTLMVEKIENTVGPIEMALLNAGTYTPDTLENFSAESFKKLYEVNVFGTVNCLEPVLNQFKKRKRGHVAIVASVAGYRGLPSSLAYGSSKAALINLCEALAAESAGSGIKVQVISPGFVKTPLTDKNEFPMPMLMPVDKAADKLVKGLSSSRFEITFPWIFAFLTKLFGLLPNRAYIWAIGKIKRKRDKS